jgi:hypothetical protein
MRAACPSFAASMAFSRSRRRATRSAIAFWPAADRSDSFDLSALRAPLSIPSDVALSG